MKPRVEKWLIYSLCRNRKQRKKERERYREKRVEDAWKVLAQQNSFPATRN